uniref:NADH dehydrogenase subunit 2 n=1 Tax=Marshallagia marshalli TaxID=106947 RepID=A0A343QXG9_9BILA|nr:NADH dehydrogenase subunit 2 [Marshallagia marshalli]ATV81512.1 NADH dehydrogenase subunit 2 [Marshallagia marshalli]
MLFFLMVVVFAVSLLTIMVHNVMLWWSVFLLMTIVFVMLNKMLLSFNSIFNYFILQESLGLMFLMLTFGYLQLLILMLKIGVAPLHFWIFSVTNGVYGFNLMWFLTFQKLPFLLVLVNLVIVKVVLLLFMGLLFCLVQMFLTKTYKNLLILSSTESFNWLLLGVVYSVINVIMIFCYYMLLMLIMIPKFNFNFQYISWETTLVFMNLPFTVNFFVKIFSLLEILKVDSSWVLVILFLMFLSILSLSFWLINLSVSFVNNSLNYSKIIYMFTPFMIVLLV